MAEKKEKTWIVCPACKQEIDHLIHIQSGYLTYKCVLSEKGTIDYEKMDEDADGAVVEYYCPWCDETLAWCEPDAEDILKGKYSQVVL